jgi:hypothetical protein
MRRCRPLQLLQRSQKTRGSLVFISVCERLEVMELGRLVLVPRQRSGCWLVMGSGSVGLRMLRLSRTTGLVDLVVGAADASNPVRGFLLRRTLLRYGG